MGAPGPDGFPPGFIKQHWNKLGNDVIALVQGFFLSKKLPAGINHTYISLIPKVPKPTYPTEFRLISLSNATYKIISKILTNRLKPMLDRLISQNQSAFISKRKITDNIIVAHELLHSMKTRRLKHGSFALKLDLSKDFDRLEWDVVVFMLKSFGFDNSFCDLIFECISTGLSRLLAKFEADGKIEGLKAAHSSPPITHLLFADDFFVFGKASITQVRHLLEVFNIFCSSSGQAINFQKSGIYFPPKFHHKHCKLIANVLKVKRISKDDRYLGTPLFFHRAKTLNFDPLLEKTYARLRGWKSKLLSQAGSTILISSVTSAFPTFQMSFTEFPDKTLAKMDRLQRDFWWNKSDQKNRVYSKDWKSICIPKSQGGLGLRNPKKFNVSMLTRLTWRVISNPNALWVKVLKSKYFKNTNPLLKSRRTTISWIWSSIRTGMEILRENCILDLSLHSNLDIWSERWIPNAEFPIHPTVIEEETPMKINDLITDNGHWNVDILNTYFAPYIVHRILTLPVPNAEVDELKWLHTKDGVPSVKSVYRVLTKDLGDHNPIWKKIWKLKCQPRVQLFLWKLYSDALPFNSRLARHTKKASPSCCLCTCGQNEDAIHLFINCPFVTAIWFGLGLTPLFAGSNYTTMHGWIDYLFHNYNKILVGKATYVMWSVWKHRCDVIFKKLRPNKTMLVKDISFQLSCIEKKGISIDKMSVVDNRTDLQSLFRKNKKIILIDASFDHLTGRYGTASILMDDNGECQHARASFGLTTGPEEAECIALKDAIGWALMVKAISDIIFVGDCVSVIQSFKDFNINLGRRGKKIMRVWQAMYGCFRNCVSCFLSRDNIWIIDTHAKGIKSSTVSNFTTLNMSHGDKDNFFQALCNGQCPSLI
ncbi:uncharacterized protein LOC113310013 [Papaver somniferum]|uniref:uncharacterized protein LOC113310013 n=1 Tax=Papaver somniferum TaxID=3469 RepID=UPI000E6FA2E2|nr:uncharacterized protein LOC113310013 [Papaver somniferum]